MKTKDLVQQLFGFQENHWFDYSKIQNCKASWCDWKKKRN